MMVTGSVMLMLCPFQPSLQNFIFCFILLETLSKPVSGLVFVLMSLLSRDSGLSAICSEFHAIKERLILASVSV